MSKKKIGIMTLSASDNCGSLLQTYALMKTLQKMGESVDVINYNSIESKRVYNVIPTNIFKHPKRLLFAILHIKRLIKQKKDYKSFREKHLVMSKEICNTKELLAIKDNYKYIVCGSDQIWNVRMADFNYDFFLDWADDKQKIAYAASLGKCSFSDYKGKEDIKKSLNSFKAISVREKHGQEEILKLIGKKVPVLADPTLLLSQDEWSQLAGAPQINEPYIFFYSWAYNNHKINDIVSKYSKEKGLKVYVINPSKWNKKSAKSYGFILHNESGPIAFLNLMKYATVSFVQSFHGVIFSNIFKKEFFFLDEHDDLSLDARLDAILDIYNKKDRIIRKYEEINEKKAITFDENEKLVKIRRESISFLEKELKEGTNDE